MEAIFYTICMVALWVVNMFNGTGMGTVYRTTEITIAVCMVLAVICVASQSLKDGELLIKPRYFYTIFPFLVLFCASIFYNNKPVGGLDAFWGFLLIYIMSKARPTHTAIRMTAICYAVLGLFILVVFNFTDTFKGWNKNTIAMIGLFSFLTFTIPFYGMREWRSFIVMPLIGTAYVYLLLPTGSRSCTLIIALQLLLVLRIIPVRKLLESRWGLTFIVTIPVFIAVLVIVVSSFADVSGLTEWSIETFDKPLFNGRDRIWWEGIQRIVKKPFLGNGDLYTGYWHNCAVACMVSLGVPGFVLWARMFYLILGEGKPYLDDICVIGSITAFSVLYCQQSLELGILVRKPNMIPYIILGILLGRINYLKTQRSAS